MTDHLPGDSCPACLADADQRHAELVAVRNACILWGEAGHLAAQQGNTQAASVASFHLMLAFMTLDEADQAVLINYMFVNTIALGSELAGGYGVWLEGMDADQRQWLEAFVASDGVDCTCAVEHGPLPYVGGVFMKANLDVVDVDGEPV